MLSPTTAEVCGKKAGGSTWDEGREKDRQVEELSDKLAQAEMTVTQLRSKVNQLQDMKINGEMLINKKQQQIRELEDQVRGRSIPSSSWKILIRSGERSSALFIFN